MFLVLTSGVKQVVTQSATAGQRYKLGFSDGDFWATFMLATQLNDAINSQAIRVGSIVRVTEHLRNDVQGRK